MNRLYKLTDDMYKFLELEQDTTGECELSIAHPETILEDRDNFFFYRNILKDRIQTDGQEAVLNSIYENVIAENFTLEQGYRLINALGLTDSTGQLDFLKYLREETKRHERLY